MGAAAEGNGETRSSRDIERARCGRSGCSQRERSWISQPVAQLSKVHPNGRYVSCLSCSRGLWDLRRIEAPSLDRLDADGREHHKLTRCFIRHAGKAFLDPETERVKDGWGATPLT
jgi:hypothetical protein